MKRKLFGEILNDAARDRIPDDLNLLPRIAAQYEMQKGSRMKPKFKFALAAVLALAVLAVILFSVPTVAEAMQRVLGYVPGLGLVEQGAPLRVLAEPVSVDRDGVSLTVENGSSDSQRTILLISVQGVSSEGATACANGSPQLRLADGTVFPVKEGAGYGRDNEYYQRLVFDALPAKGEKVTLEIPCLMMHVAGKTPENWQIPLVFEAAPDLQVAPVIELPPVPAGEPLAQPEQPVESPYGIALAVEKMVALDDGYILMGNISWTDETLGDYSVSLFDPLIVDAQGNAVPFEFVSPDVVPEPGSKRSNWAMKIEGKEQHWPITIQGDADVTLSLTDRPSFTLDLSNPPAEGQSKELNIDLEAGGHTIKVLSYTTGKDPDANGTLTFRVLGDPEVMSVMFFDTTNPVLGGGGGGGGGGGNGAPTEPVPFETSFTYNGALPGGQTQIAVTAVMLRVDGNWEVNWKP
jgi:hypothetical protein